LYNCRSEQMVMSAAVRILSLELFICV
jgi:hypothetical protein